MTGSNDRLFSIFSILMILITISWGVSFGFSWLFICNGHFTAWWASIAELEEHCKTELDFQLGFAISDFISDLIVLAMPIPFASVSLRLWYPVANFGLSLQIWRLHMSAQRRIATIAAFGLGSL